MKPSKKQIVSWAGTALMVASLAFLAHRLFQSRADMDRNVLITGSVVAGLVLVAMVEGFGILMASLNFRGLIKNVSGVQVTRPLALVVYTLSNLYKYIPGGVMYVVGRNRLAVETEELSHPKVALSTVLEGIIIVIAAIVIVVVTVLDYAVVYMREEVEWPASFLPVLIVILAVAALLIFMLRQKIMYGLRKLFEHMQLLRPLVLIKRFGFGLILMTLWGGTFLATLVVMGQELAPGLAPMVIGLFLLAWLAGFLTPGAPSGLGVREIVMLMFMGGILGDGTLNEGILLSAMFVHRIVAAAGDIAAYGVAVGYAHFSKPQ